jgi:hypothetical protein
VEEIIYFLGQRAADAIHGFKIGETGAGDGAGRAEMLQQGAFAGGADARDFVERIGADGF